MSEEDELDPNLEYVSNEATRAYKTDPTIENYLRLRKNAPRETIEIAVTVGIEMLYPSDEELAKFGIDSKLVHDAILAVPEAITELCLVLLERLVERDRRQHKGETHLSSRGEAIGDRLVNYLIQIMLDGMDWAQDLQISRDLIVLIRHQLGGDLGRKKKLGERDGRVRAISVAGQLLLLGKNPSYRRVADVLDVSATTVMRWFPEKDLEQRARSWAESPLIKHAISKGYIQI